MQKPTIRIQEPSISLLDEDDEEKELDFEDLLKLGDEDAVPPTHT